MFGSEMEKRADTALILSKIISVAAVPAAVAAVLLSHPVDREATRAKHFITKM